MTVEKTYVFSKELVVFAPSAHGVYVLYDDTGIIYIGEASGKDVSIRSRLLDHLRGDHGRWTQTAKHFWWEVNANPTARERVLLQEFRAKNGRLPRCNSVMP